MRRRRGMGRICFHVSIQVAKAFECFAAFASGFAKLSNPPSMAVSYQRSARRGDFCGLRETSEARLSAEDDEDLIEPRARRATGERDARGLRDVLDLEAGRREVFV